MYALHFIHLAADFPGHFPWNDWVKYSDEGWYLNAVTRHFLLGHWYLPGDFNPAVALPVWPTLVALLFHFTSVSIVACRALQVALFGVTLTATFCFVRRLATTAVALSVLSFAVVSPYFFAFTRLAIVEPAVLTLFAVSLLVASLNDRRLITTILLGCLLALLLASLVLGKPTAAVLFPAVGYVYWRTLPPTTLRARIALAAWPCVLAAILYAFYYAAVVHFGYQADYHYLFAANQFPHPATLKAALIDFRFTLQGIFAVDRLLALTAALVLVFFALGPFRQLWSSTLFLASLLTLAGNLAFIFWHSYQAPHYYLFSILPLAVLVSQAAAAAHVGASPTRRAFVGVFLAAILLAQAATTLRIALHPQYTQLGAARSLASYIDQHPYGNRLLLSGNGDQIMLMTGLPSLCADFGTIPLSAEIAARQPGWFAAWHGIDPLTLSELHRQNHLQRAAAYHLMDDPESESFILYRLVPLSLPDEGVTLRSTGLHTQHRPLTK